MKNIDKYINNTTQTSNGVVFKDNDAFKAKKGICYISEYALEAITIKAENEEDWDADDEELIEMQVAETYETIKAQCEDFAENHPEDFEEMFGSDIYNMIVYIFFKADWAYIATEILQLTY